jgi:peroxiredoxin-like protein
VPSLLEPHASHRPGEPPSCNAAEAESDKWARCRENAQENAMNQSDSYIYEVRVEWTGRRAGHMSAAGLPSMDIAPPPEFGGEAGKWTPEHLLVAASASCMMATFVAIAQISQLELESFQMMTQARLEKIPGEGYRFTEFTLAPEIGVAAKDVERAQRVLDKAEKSCLVNKALRATVRVEPKFVTAPAEVPV